MKYTKLQFKTIGFKGISLFLVFLAAIFPLLACPSVFAKEESRVVRVAYPIQEGLTERDGENGYKGYTYEYLMEISRYTNWQYEFVEVDGDLNTQIITLLDMLEKGEVDLMGGLADMPGGDPPYDLSSYNYGTSYSILCVKKDNAEIDSYNYFYYDELRVAMLKTAKNRNAKLEQFAQSNGFSIVPVYCETEEEQLEQLESGNADAMLGLDLSIPSNNLRTVARFAPQSFYFATTKGNTEIVSGINSAMVHINESNPYFETALYEKYFGTNAMELYLTKEEKEFIKQQPPLKIVLMGGRAPIQYRNQKTGEIQGITKNVIDYISEQTGLRFELTMTDTYEEYLRLQDNEETDLLAGIAGNNELSNWKNYSFTAYFLTAPTVLVVAAGLDPGELSGKRLALPQDVDYSGEYRGVVTRYDTIEECLEAIHRGDADYCYGNSYSVQYYLSDPSYKNMLTISRADEWSLDFCFGISKSADPILFSVLNKTIQSISKEELIEKFLYTNSYREEDITFWTYIQSNPVQAYGGMLVFLLAVAVVFLLWSRHNYVRESQRRQLQNERYKQISELSNEYFYQYDILRDRLEVSEKSAKLLGCDMVSEHLSRTLVKQEGKTNADHTRLFEMLAGVQDGSEEVLYRSSDGEAHWYEIIRKTISDNDGKPILTIGKIKDIDEEKRKQMELLNKAQRDSLTGIYNAAISRERITQEMKEPDFHTGALLVVDVDHFKVINDTYGHLRGDQVLVGISNIFQETFPDSAIMGRLGGDEFAIFLINPQERDFVVNRVKHMRERLRQMSEEMRILSVTLSVGIAFTNREEPFDALYQRADRALYQTKDRGRDGYSFDE